MTITLFNNWKTDKEFILVEVSFSEEVFTFALMGFGIIII